MQQHRVERSLRYHKVADWAPSGCLSSTKGSRSRCLTVSPSCEGVRNRIKIHQLEPMQCQDSTTSFGQKMSKTLPEHQIPGQDFPSNLKPVLSNFR